MADTTVAVSIGGIVVDDDVINVDIWSTKSTGISSCNILIDNDADKWGSTFSANDAISVIIDDGAPGVMFVGFVDNVKPYLSRQGVLTNELEITGRNHGRYLVDYYHTQNYKEQASGVTIDEILLALGDPLTYVDPGGTPLVKYNCLRTKLGTALMDVAQLATYDFYIDTAGALQYFPVGSVDSGVDLICLPGDATNNLLAFEEFEQIGYDIKNRVEIHAGSVKDHWTEENAADWSVEAGAGAIVDETTIGIVMFGAGCIQVVDLGINDVTVVLDFPAGPGGELYSYSSLDMTKYGQAKVVFRPENGSTGAFDFRPVLIDGTGKQITFTRRKEGRSSKGFTEEVDASFETHHPLSFPVGEHDNNEISNRVRSGFWHAVGWVYVKGVTEFDWGDVDKLGFQLRTGLGMNVVTFDALYLPSVEARSVKTNAASIVAYDTRMHSEYRSDLKSQRELDDYGELILDYKKDSIQKFRATAKGQRGTRYVAQTVHVRAPDYGIFALTPYIIVQLHHILHHYSDVRGWDFITQYELVSSDTQPIRVVRDNNPVEAMLLELYARLEALEAAKEDEDYWLGDVETGITPQIERGANFPTDMRDGDEFFLTADLTVGPLEYYGPALYKYDNTAGDWVRNPIVLHRGAFPVVAGGYEGDTLYRTDTDTWYRFTGGAWTVIVISGGSLVKGVQPFDSAILFEAIRAAATSVNTFNVDVNDVTDPGKARITGPNGTFSDFTAGDKVIVQNAEDPDNNTTLRSVASIDPANDAWIKLNGILGGADTPTDEQIMVSAMDAIKWTNNGANPEIWFADGDTQHINSGSAQGMATGANWVYFTVAAAGLTVTSNYALAVGSDVGVICRLEVYTDGEPLIFPFQSRGGNMSGDALAYGSVDTLILTSEEIYGKHFATAYNVGGGLGSPPGVRFDSSGIYGYTGGGVQMFYISALDGSAYFLGGLAYFDDSAMHVWHDGGAGYSSGIILYDNAGNPMGYLSPHTNHIALRSDANGFVVMSNELGDSYIKIFDVGASHGQIEITTHNGKDILLIPSVKTLSFASIEPNTDHTKDMGVPGKTWRYFNPVTNLAGRPAANVNIVGLQWITSEGGATDGIMWVCMRNDGGGYEWVELGRTA